MFREGDNSMRKNAANLFMISQNNQIFFNLNLSDYQNSIKAKEHVFIFTF